MHNKPPPLEYCNFDENRGDYAKYVINRKYLSDDSILNSGIKIMKMCQNNIYVILMKSVKIYLDSIRLE